MRRDSRDRVRLQRGFVISVELILIFSILVIGSLVGVIAVRNAIVRLLVSHRAAKVVVKDSSVPPLILGKPVSYDLCEAPQILCRDFGFDENNNGMAAMPGPSDGLKALVGVRPDRFVTRNQIYFAGDGCTGAAYLAPPPIPGSPNFPPFLPVGYYNCGIQIDAAGDHVCYGAGPPSNWPCALGTTCVDGGRLYRSDGTTTSRPTIRSRWVSLNPDCALDAGGNEMIVNGGFENPAFVGNGDFFPRDNPGPLVGWTVVQTNPFGPGGWEDPCVVGEVAPCTNGLPSFTVPPPEGKQIGFSIGDTTFPGTPELSQAVTLNPGETCTFSFWLGCHSDSNCATGPGANYQVDIVNSSGIAQFPPVTGFLGPGSPEWQQVTRTFVVSGPAPHTVRLEASAREVTFDAVSLTCSVAPPSTEICDDSYETSFIDLLPAVEVTDMSGANLLAPYMPLFNVMPPVAPTFTLTPPEPEAMPTAPPAISPTPPAPEGS